MLDSLQELTEFLEPFEKEEQTINTSTDPEKTYEDFQDYVIQNLPMPEFFTTEPYKPVYTIRHTPKNSYFKLYDNDGFFLRESKNVVELYDSVIDGIDIVFEGDYQNLKGIKPLGKTHPSLIVEEENKNTSRFLISHTSKSSHALQKTSYLDFLRTAKEYLQDPTDFLKSWTFLDTHPYGWYTQKEQPTDWITDGLISKMWIRPTLNEETNQLVFMMETGSSVPPERNYHYHDLRLDVYAPTYNEGIIQTAALVHKFFYLNGEERPDVQYQKSKLELTLEERLNDLKKETEENK